MFRTITAHTADPRGVIFSSIRRLGPLFGSKTLNINIFLTKGFQKKMGGWGMKILWIFSGVITNMDWL